MMLTVAIFMIVRNQKRSRCPSVDEWIKGTSSIKEYYSAAKKEAMKFEDLKKKKKFAGKWM